MNGENCALVTGAATGIGLKISQDLSARGYKVIALSAPWEDASALAKIPNTDVLLADLRDRGLKSTVCGFLSERDYALRVLVNNASVFERRSFADIDLSLLMDTFQVNLFAPVVLSQVLLERKSNDGPCYIVNIASDAAVVGSKRGAHYAASKGALISLTRSLAKICRDQGVLVNAVAPTVTRTRQSEVPDMDYEAVGRETMIGRVSEPSDVSNAVCGIISGNFDYMTGALINLTGGRYLW
jgi:NAD(P)-dependent dehydrogenase (short-subunit alcohol dehydrogenase family)